MSTQFASKGDLTAKQISFTQLSPNCWAYTAEGDPNSGVIIGDDACMVIDTTATPAMARSASSPSCRTIGASTAALRSVVLCHGARASSNRAESRASSSFIRGFAAPRP